MPISKKEILHLAKLSRLEISNEEAENFKMDLNKILDYIAELNNADIKNTFTMFQVNCQENEIRKDIIELDYKGRKSDMLGKILNEAPELEGNYFKVPPILDKTSDN